MITSELFQVLAFCCEATPVFNNLIQLTVESDEEVGWDSLPGLLKNCPNLETLVFKVSLFFISQSPDIPLRSFCFHSYLVIFDFETIL